jgi:hypothetical protein
VEFATDLYAHLDLRLPSPIPMGGVCPCSFHSLPSEGVRDTSARPSRPSVSRTARVIRPFPGPFTAGDGAGWGISETLVTVRRAGCEEGRPERAAEGRPGGDRRDRRTSYPPKGQEKIVALVAPPLREARCDLRACRPAARTPVRTPVCGPRKPLAYASVTCASVASVRPPLAPPD